MSFGFDDLKIGLEMFKTAIGLAKDAKDLLPDGENRKTVETSLDEAVRAAALAEAQIAQGLGYRLCKCTFPPQIMLSIGYQGVQERFQCPNCKKISPDPRPLNTGTSQQNWMA